MLKWRVLIKMHCRKIFCRCFQDFVFAFRLLLDYENLTLIATPEFTFLSTVFGLFESFFTTEIFIVPTEVSLLSKFKILGYSEGATSLSIYL